MKKDLLIRYAIVLLGLNAVVCAGMAKEAVVNEITGADELVPLERYLVAPSFEAPRISPDGRHIVVLANVDGVRNLMLADTAKPTELHALTHDKGRGFQSKTIWEEPTFRWAENGRNIFYIRDDEGDENWVLYSLDIVSGVSRQLTPAKGVRVRGLQISPKFPDEVLFSMNDKGPYRKDYYRANAKTGEVKHVASAAPYLAKLFDQNFQERVAVDITPDMGLDIRVRGKDGLWPKLARIAPEDLRSVFPNQFNDLGTAVISADGRKLLMFSSHGQDTTAWNELDLQSGKLRVLAVEKGVDIRHALVHPTSFAPQAYIRHYTQREWIVLDPSLKADFKFLQSQQAGELQIESRTDDDQQWIVSFMRPDQPVRFALYQRAPRRLVPLQVATPQLLGMRLSDMRPLVTRSSDGYELVSYIAYPSWIKLNGKGLPMTPMPMVTIVHGGPSDERAETGFAPVLQWLTNRGYAVFVVNFRGSAGFGKAFMNAQRHEWGGAMNRDVVEQVQSLVRQGIADPKRLAVFGGSYGGYETLAAMTLTPDVFACGVAVVGPSNLETFIDPATQPPDGKLDEVYDVLGDPKTEAGRQLLHSRSPFYFADQTKGRMLIVQGANDVRVPTRESDQVVAAMDKHGVKVTYLLYPDEGHGIKRKENARSYYAVTEAFLGECLKGRYAPIVAAQMEGASVRVPVGVAYIPGLKEALAARKDDGLLQVNAAISDANFADFAGAYGFAGARLAVTLEGKRLFMDVPGQGKFEMLPFEKDGFFMREGPVKLRFQRGADSVVDAVTVEASGGNPRSAKRIRD